MFDKTVSIALCVNLCCYCMVKFADIRLKRYKVLSDTAQVSTLGCS